MARRKGVEMPHGWGVDSKGLVRNVHAILLVSKDEFSKCIFTIIAEILARSLANFYCQYADRHMNL